jgi:hypothetical protein
MGNELWGAGIEEGISWEVIVNELLQGFELE